MFENITAAPADPILGLADLFRADERPGKINLGPKHTQHLSLIHI